MLHHDFFIISYVSGLKGTLMEFDVVNVQFSTQFAHFVAQYNNIGAH